MIKTPCRKYDWIAIQKEFASSGKTAKQFCSDKGIPVGAFYHRRIKKDSAEIQRELENAVKARKDEIVKEWSEVILEAKEKYNKACMALMNLSYKKINELTDKALRHEIVPSKELKMTVETVSLVYFMHKDVLFSFDVDKSAKGLPEMPIQQIETFVKDNKHLLDDEKK